MVIPFRIYVESSVIADWLLIEASTRRQRKRLTEKVVSSHKLVNFLLHQTNGQVQSFTSDWALFEAVDVIKRGYIEIRMVADGISTRFYSDLLKDSDEYKLENTFILKINKLIDRLITKNKKTTSPLIAFRETADIDIGIPLILKNNLEAADSFHVGIAVTYACNYLISKDHHYFRRNITEALKEKITIMRPQAFIDMLAKEGFSIS